MVKRSRLDGKVALVTGGARGIGRAIALQLAEDGADVAINYQYTKEQAEQVSKLIDQIGIWELHNRPGNRYKRRTLHLK